MSEQIDVRLDRRFWLIRLLRPSSAFKVILTLDPSTTTQAESRTIHGAWDGAVAMAEIFHGAEILDRCPFPESNSWVERFHKILRAADRWVGRKLHTILNRNPRTGTG